MAENRQFISKQLQELSFALAARRIARLVKVLRVLRPLIRLAHRAVVGDRRAQPVRRGLAVPRRRCPAAAAAAAITHRALATAGRRGRGGRRGQTEEIGEPTHCRRVLPEHLLIREREQRLAGSIGEHARGEATRARYRLKDMHGARVRHNERGASKQEARGK